MSTKEMICNAVNKLNDKQASALLAFINSMFETAEPDEMQTVLDDVKNGKNLSRPFNDLNELWEELNADS